MKRPAANAFTLIELLVVVAIIVALLAILLPAINKALALANSAACLSNLRQMQVASMAYVADHRGAMIPLTTNVVDGTGTGENGGTWLHLMLERYHRNPEIRFCPDANAIGGTRFGGRNEAWNDYSIASSYCANAWVFGTSNAVLYGHPVSKHYSSPLRVQQASDTPLVFDGNWFGAYPYNDPQRRDVPGVTEWNDTLPGGSEINRMVFNRHPGQATNGVFVDGHAESVYLGDMWKYKWNVPFEQDGERTIPWLGS